LNSPETPLFHKGDNLYNLATARQATHNGSPLIVVEGYVDVIAMVTAGFAGAVGAAWHGFDGKPARAALEDGGRADSSVSTATAPDRRRRIAPPTSHCLLCTRQEPALCLAAGRPGPG
jgi:hypothetical protein